MKGSLGSIHIVNGKMEVWSKLCSLTASRPLVLGIAVCKHNSALPKSAQSTHVHLFLSPGDITCDPPPHSIRTAHLNHPFDTLPRLCIHHRLQASAWSQRDPIPRQAIQQEGVLCCLNSNPKLSILAVPVRDFRHWLCTHLDHVAPFFSSSVCTMDRTGIGLWNVCILGLDIQIHSLCTHNAKFRPYHSVPSLYPPHCPLWGIWISLLHPLSVLKNPFNPQLPFLVEIPLSWLQTSDHWYSSICDGIQCQGNHCKALYTAW